MEKAGAMQQGIHHRASLSLSMHICKMAIKRQSVRIRGLSLELSEESMCSSLNTGSPGNMLEMVSSSQAWQCTLVISAFEKQVNHLKLESSLGSGVRLSQKFKHNITKLS